uniref:Uncharacterized protein n=1 Tax=Arundo donax TaxID=35708 RepID=A0A0A9CAS6_ARUDO
MASVTTRENLGPKKGVNLDY